MNRKCPTRNTTLQPVCYFRPSSVLLCSAMQSVVMPQYVVCPSVCDVQLPWSHRLEYLCAGWSQHGRSGATGTLLNLVWNRGGVRSTKPAISSKRCKIEPRLLWQTTRKSHTQFRLEPKSMTLDDLEWPKPHSSWKKLFYVAHQKNVNEDRPKLTAAKCSSVILVSRNIRYMRIFAAWVPQGRGIKRQWGSWRA